MRSVFHKAQLLRGQQRPIDVRRRRLVVADGLELRPVLFRLQDRRLPLPWQILEGVGLEQRLVELASLEIAQL